MPIQHRGELRLVSLTLGSISFAIEGSELQVNRPKADLDGRIFIKGEDKRPGKSYRLDCIVPDEALLIDLAAAIRPKGITAEDLGLVAWAEGPEGQINLPISTGSIRPQTDDAVMVVKSPTAVIQAVRQVCDLEAGSCKAQEVVASNLPSGGLIEMTLSREANPQHLEVRLTTLGPGNTIRAEVVKLLLPGVND